MSREVVQNPLAAKVPARPRKSRKARLRWDVQSHLRVEKVAKARKAKLKSPHREEKIAQDQDQHQRKFLPRAKRRNRPWPLKFVPEMKDQNPDKGACQKEARQM